MGTASATFIAFRHASELELLIVPQEADGLGPNTIINTECSYPVSFMKFGPVPKPIVKLLS